MTPATLHTRKSEAEKRLRQARDEMRRAKEAYENSKRRYDHAWYEDDAIRREINRQLERQTVGQEEGK